VHGGAGGEDDGGESEESEEEKGRPEVREVRAESSPGGSESAADAAVGLTVGKELQAELHGVDLDEIEVETEDGGGEKEDDDAGERCEESAAANDVFVDVIGPLALEERERAEDEGGDEQGEEGDANEAPEMEEALLEKCAETCGGICLVGEESAGYEQKVDEEIERDGGVTEDGSGVSDRALVEVQKGLAEGADVKAAEEALSGEGVVEQGGELAVEADREEEGEGEIEDIGPEQRREAAECKREAVEEDVAASGHDWNLGRSGATATADPPFGFAQGRPFGDDNQKSNGRCKGKKDNGRCKGDCYTIQAKS
jgi:hypothetical protein